MNGKTRNNDNDNSKPAVKIFPIVSKKNQIDHVVTQKISKNITNIIITKKLKTASTSSA